MEAALAAAARCFAAAAGGGDRRGGADEAADQERTCSRAPAVVVHGTIVRVRIATLGDLTLDVIVRLEQPLAAGGDVGAHTRTGAGGQAANVAAWAVELGAEARCIAKRGDDDAGELVARELAEHNVELVGPVVDGATGVVVSIVGASAALAAARRRRELAQRRLHPAGLAAFEEAPCFQEEERAQQ